MFRTFLCAAMLFASAASAATADPPKDAKKTEEYDPTKRFAVPPTVVNGPESQPPPINKGPVFAERQPADQVAEVVGAIYVIADESSPGKIIVLDASGKWLPTVREIRQDVTLINGQNPTIVCTMYEGTYRPTKPVVKTWQLAQSKTVASHDFQQMIDSLQTNPEALRTTIRK